MAKRFVFFIAFSYMSRAETWDRKELKAVTKIENWGAKASAFNFLLNCSFLCSLTNSC